MPNNNFIFTKHALKRQKLRKINLTSINQVINFYDQKIKLKNDLYKFGKIINQRKIQLIAQYLKRKKQYLIISLWVRGENDPLPIVWQIIILPFKIIWWILKFIFSHLFKS